MWMLGAQLRPPESTHYHLFVGFDGIGLTFGLRYDTRSTSKISMAINRNEALEVSVSYTWQKKNTMQTKTILFVHAFKGV